VEGDSHDELIEYLNSIDSVTCLWNKRIHKLHEIDQRVLKVASLLGFKFDGFFLEEAVKLCSNHLQLPENTDVKSILYRASKQRVLRVDADTDTSQYTFMHDVVQTYLLNLWPRTNDAYHYAIGYVAKTKLNSKVMKNQDWLLFTSVFNLNQVRQMVVDDDDDGQDEMVKLILKASNCALFMNSFVTVTELSHNGLFWTNGGNWGTHYESTLSLTNNLIKAYQERGYMVECQKNVNLVIQNARCLEDKLEVYFSWINCLQSKGKYAAIIDFCVDHLEEIGEGVPRQPSKLQVIFEIIKTRNRLRRRSFSSILELPKMSDKRKILALRLLSAIILNSFFLQRRELLFLASLKSVRITLAYGSCEETAFTFACYGMLLAFLKNQEGAYRFGELANRLLDNCQLKDSISPATCVIAFSCLHWQQRGLDKLITVLLKGYRVGNQVGDIQWAILNGVTMIGVSFSCGRHLHELEDETRTFCFRMTAYDNYKDFLTLCYPLWQCILNLSVSSQNTENCELTGDIMNQGEMEVQYLETHNYTGLLILYGACLQVAFYFKDIELAFEMAEKLEKYSTLRGASFACNQVKFFSALTYIRLDRDKASHKYSRKVDKFIKDLKKTVAKGTVSCAPLLLLLQAERSSLRENKQGLKKKYDDAIASAQALNMVNFQALANECAGLVFLVCDPYLSDHYLTEALEYYFQWGAMRKVEQMETEYASLLSRSRPKVVTSISSSKGSTLSKRSKSETTNVDKGETAILPELDLGLQLEKRKGVLADFTDPQGLQFEKEKRIFADFADAEEEDNFFDSKNVSNNR